MHQNKAQLITYPDSLGGNLAALAKVLAAPFRDLFPGGVHILPPYPSTGDRGFAPRTYDTIDPEFGTWDEITSISSLAPVILDIMINHISRESAPFRELLAKGFPSRYADMFIPMEKIWPDGKPAAEDLEKIFLRRRAPFSTYPSGKHPEGITVWTTFGATDPSEQVDIDVFSPVTRSFLENLLSRFAQHQVSSLRLDAVGYVTKKRGTDCFFVEPDIFDFLNWLRETADRCNISLLPEIHAPLPIQNKLAANGFASYDFASPFLILDALIHHNADYLVQYTKRRPPDMVTMLDCHDGIPVLPDIAGLLPAGRITKTLGSVASQPGSNFSKLFAREAVTDGVDVHQINATYFSALGNDEKALLTARAIQLFLPGTPQIYYVGLLAGENSVASQMQQNDPRAVNRRNYTLSEIEAAMGNTTVQGQIELIRLRNSHPAFGGEFSMTAESPSVLTLTWRSGTQRCSLTADLSTYDFSITS